MKTNLKKCTHCGRLFSGVDEIQQCHVCADEERAVYKKIEDAIALEGLKTISAIAAAIGVDPSTVKRILAELPLAAQHVECDEPCPRCGVRPLTIGKDFCGTCALEVDADLRDMAGRVEREIAARAQRPEADLIGLSVSAARREKQRRTRRRRFAPASPHKKRP